LADPKEIALSEADGALYTVGHTHSHAFELGELTGLEQSRGLLWSSIIARAGERTAIVRFIPNPTATRFLSTCNSRVLQSRHELLEKIRSNVDRLARAEQYVAARDLRGIVDQLAEWPLCLVKSRDLAGQVEDHRLRETLALLSAVARSPEEWRERTNERYIESEEDRSRDLFDSIEKYPLTHEQRRAVLLNEENNLVAASAGSGKTSVIVAKAAHLLKKGLCQPHELLLLSYTNASTQDLQDRLQTGLTGVLGPQAAIPEVRTYHSLGYQILGAVTGRKPPLAQEADDQAKLAKTVQGIIEKGAEEPPFLAAIGRFFQSHFTTYRNAFEFGTLREYVDYARSHELRTLHGDKVKSYEECEIANFLYMNGVEYVYEKEYEFVDSDSLHRAYRPDFYLPAAGLYIEHFAIGRGDSLPGFMTEVERTKYLRDMRWKKQVHQANGTRLVETFSYERSEGVLLTNLAHKLAKHGVELKGRPPEEVFAQLRKLGHIRDFSRLNAEFLNHVRSSRWSIAELRSRIDGGAFRDKARLHAFLGIFETVQARYERLMEDVGEIDFHDMINLAADYAERGDYASPYKYVLVDEFQDIARSRARLLRAICSLSPASVLFCVGDDWQSIYRFAGSDVGIMRSFGRQFGICAQANLTRSFRLNDEVASFSTAFILHNPDQLPKHVVTERRSLGGAIHVGLCREDQHAEELILMALDQISAGSSGARGKILVLGRYWHNKPDALGHIVGRYPGLSIEYSTVHSAKGLEADHVIVCGVSSGRYGFPTEISDDPIIGLALPENEKYPNAEERRLFYVAMTRTRGSVFIIGSSGHVSPFVEEALERGDGISTFGDRVLAQPLCPRCETGRLTIRQGTNGAFMGCSNYPHCLFSMSGLRKCPTCGGEVRLTTPGYLLECENRDFAKRTRLCPSCQSGLLVHRHGTYGWFMGCTSYPTCKYTEELESWSTCVSHT
jgi:DNA helicase-4